jgi:hypothetical protein
MVIHPFSPHMLPSDYHQRYSTPPPYDPSRNSSRKRKRHVDNEDANEFIRNDHVQKKQRDELVLVTPLTPTSPPSTFSSIQMLSPPSEQDIHYVYQSNVIANKEFPAPSYVATQEHLKHHSSDINSSIPPQNLFLRNLHLKSRTYQYNQNRIQELEKHDHDHIDEDDEMWEEEEVVTDRYSAMNKLLGSRKASW